MSCHKQNFQCFSAVGGQGSHKSCPPFKHPTARLPRIPHHGMVAHHDLLEECCLCSEYHHAMEARENHLLPFYHAHPPYHHHCPHQYVPRGPSRPEEGHSRSEHHLHHRRCKKRVVLVKNSDPSCRKVIVLHHRILRSFALFLEEVSELMQYHIRKLYTQEGRKIDSVPSLLQCPGVLVCVGREPTHPSIIENFEKRSDDKLPGMSPKPHSTRCTNGHEKDKTSIISSNVESYSRSTQKAAPSDTSGPDGTNSPDLGASCPPTDKSVKEDDIEKLVRVNKDGSLTMEMKVRFRLQNDQTLHWSTKVRKTKSGTCDYTQGHNNSDFAQVCDVSCSESENISAEDACFPQHHQGHIEEPHCAHCCSHCQDYDLWKPGTRGTSRCIQSSSSSASSLTVVSRKTVVERQTVSRSSEDLTEEIVERETCVTQSIKAAETVEFCTMRSESCSPNSNMPSPKLNNDEAAGMSGCQDDVLKVKSDQEQEESVEDEVKKDGSLTASRASSQDSDTKTKVAPGSEMLDISSSTDKRSTASGHTRKPKLSKPSLTCHCGVSAGCQDETKVNIMTQTKEQEELQEQTSAIAVGSNAFEEMQNTDHKEERRGSKSAMSDHPNASARCNSDALGVESEDEEAGKRPSSSTSVKSVKSDSLPDHCKPERVSSKASIKSKESRGLRTTGEEQAEEELEQRTPSVMSVASNVSAELKHLEANEEETTQLSADEAEPRAKSTKSEKSDVSGRSRSSEVTAAESDTSKNIRPQSTMSVKSTRSVQANVSPESSEFKTTDVSNKGSQDNTEDGNDGEQSEEETGEIPETSEVRSSSGVSIKSDQRAESVISVKSNTSAVSTKSKACEDGDEQQETAGRASCMSDKSIRSVSSVRSSQSNCCDKSERENCTETCSAPKSETGRRSASSLSDKSNRTECSAQEPDVGENQELKSEKRATSSASVKSHSESKSAKSHNSTKSNKSKVSSNKRPDEEERASSALSAKTDMSAYSAKSSKSKCSDVTFQEKSSKSPDERSQTENLEGRLPSSMSAKTVQSRVSEGSTNSAERPQSVSSTKTEKSFISIKSVKSNVSGAAAGFPDEEDSAGESRERSQSAQSAKNIQSVATAKSAKSIKHPGDESMSNREARASSKMSAKSGKSTKSNVSAASKKPAGVGVCSEEEGDNGDRNLRPISSQSLDSNISTRTNQTNCSDDDSVEEVTEDEREHVEERPPSSISVKSSISEMSIKSVERMPSALSTKSVISNISEVQSSSNVEERHERPQSALSNKTAKSTISTESRGMVDPAQENGFDDEGHVERAPEDRGEKSMSPQSVESNVSAKSTKSRCSTNVFVKERSNVSHEDKETNAGRGPSSMSTRSVESSVSETSAKRISGALSVKSVKSDVSELQSKATDEGDGTDETIQSALSAKMVQSTTSMGLKEHDGPAMESICGGEEREDRSPSIMSAKSARSAKSSVSTFSQNSEVSVASCKPTGENVNEEEPQDEGDIETQSMSSMSIHSMRSTRSKCSVEAPVDENIDRPKSHASAGAHSDTNPLEGRTDDRGPQDRPESALSAKSNGSKVPVAQTEESAYDSDLQERSASTQTIKSSISARSKKSKCSDAAQISDRSRENSNQEQTEGRAASCASVKTSLSNVSERSCKSQVSGTVIKDVDEQSTERAPSTFSAKSTRSVSGKSSRSAKSVKSEVSKVSDVPTEEARAASTVSAKSNVSAQSQASTRTISCEESAKEESYVCLSDCSANKSAEQVSRSKSATSNSSRKSENITQGFAEEHTEECSDAFNASREDQRKNVNRTSSRSSSKSTKPEHSNATGGSKRSGNLEVSREIKANVTGENSDGDAGIGTLSPVSVRSVKTNVTSISRKSKASNRSSRSGNSKVSEQTVREEDQTQRTESVLSVRSNTPSSTNRSGCALREKLKNEEDTSSLCAVSTKSSNDGKTEEASERRQKIMSIKSDVSVKSKKEETTLNPVSIQSDLSDAVSRSEVPAVTVEESGDRSPATMSSKSKVSGHSKRSKTSEMQMKKGDAKSQSSLSVHSHLSVKSKKSRGTEVSSKNASEVVGTSGKSTARLWDKQDSTDKGSCKTESRGTEETDAEVTVANFTTSQSATRPVVSRAESSESDLSQTLSSSDIIKEICESSAPEENKLNTSKRKVNETADSCGRVTDKSHKSSKSEEKNKEADDFDLVPSTLPNASPTEVVNEWLKTLPEEQDIYEIDELHETCDDLKSSSEAEEGNRAEGNNKVGQEGEDSERKDEENGNDVHSNGCQATTEETNEDNSSSQREDDSKMINSSIQVMKVLLNPKLDRCSSLPEVSQVYGRKLSSSAKCLLDCLVKLQLIDHEPKNVNEKDKRYQDLMRILQSLWLSDPPANEQVLTTTDHHSVDEEYNHTSSSGVDVNSGSTGSGKSSDGVKGNDDATAKQAEKDTEVPWRLEGEEKQEDDDPKTDETFRSNDSPKEPPETPSSTIKSSGDSSSTGKKCTEDAETESQEDTRGQYPTFSQETQLAKKQCHDPDPVWVLTLLTKIEKQFMAHYSSAMEEFKVRWNLEDSDQLDMMINELKTEFHQKLQTSIDREVRKIQNQVGLPRPPKETRTRSSMMQTEERRRRLKIRVQPSADSQVEKSDDSATDTSYSDQRSENIDEHCPCETCLKKKTSSMPGPSAQMESITPAVMDYDLKRILLMKSKVSADAKPCQSENKDTEALLVVEEVEDDKTDRSTEESLATAADYADHDVVELDEQEPTEQTKESGEADEKISEEDTDSSVTSGGQFKTETNEDQELEDQSEGTTEKEFENENEPDKSGQVGTTRKTSGDELLKEPSMALSNEESKEEAVSKEEKTHWSTVKKKELSSVWMISKMKRSVMQSETNGTAIVNETENKAREEAETKSADLNEDESDEEKAEDAVLERDVAADTDDNKADETAESEEAAAETSSLVTSDASEEDEADQTSLSGRESDADAVEENDKVSEDDAAEDLETTSNQGETTNEKGDTSHELSTELPGEENEDEPVAGMEIEDLSTNHSNTVAAEGGNMEESTLAATEKVSPISGDESSDEDNDSAIDSSREQGAVKTSKVSGEDKSEDDATNTEGPDVATSTDHEPDDEDVEEGENVNPGEETGVQSETDAAENPASSLEDETTDASETSVGATSERYSENDATDEEKLPAISADESSDEKNDSVMADESSKQPEEDSTARNAVTEGDEPQDEALDQIQKEDTEKMMVDDGNELRSVSEEDSGGEEDETAEENDVLSSELSTQHDDKDTKEGETRAEEEHAEENSLTTKSEEESEEDEAGDDEEEEDDLEDEPISEKHKPNLAVINEKEEETDGDTTERESDSGDETAEERCVKTTEAKETTDDREGGSGGGTDALSGEETSTADSKQETEKVSNESEEEQDETTSGEEKETESVSEENAKAMRDKTSEDVSENSSSDGEQSVEKLRARQSTGQEDTSNVKNEDSGDQSECETVDETGQEATEDQETGSEAEDGVRSAEELDEKECSEQNDEESDTSNNDGSVESKTPGDESDEDEGGRESESKCDADIVTSQNETEAREIAEEESSELDVEGSEIPISDVGEKIPEQVGTGGEEFTDGAEDEAVQDEEHQLRGDQDADTVSKPESVSDTVKHIGEEDSTDVHQENSRSCETDQEKAKDSEKEDEETKKPDEDWNGNQGESADGEDEAEEDSDEPEDESDDCCQPFTINTAGSCDAFQKAAKQTTLMPLEPLEKESVESEDGAYADVEDSETEINSQEDALSRESKSLNES
nr:retinitis pigmentosa 1-like 1 protein [Nothobranchius furzeri]